MHRVTPDMASLPLWPSPAVVCGAIKGGSRQWWWLTDNDALCLIVRFEAENSCTQGNSRGLAPCRAAKELYD